MLKSMSSVWLTLYVGRFTRAQQVRRGVSDGFANRGGDLSSDPPSAVELLRRTGALAQVDASPSI